MTPKPWASKHFCGVSLMLCLLAQRVACEAQAQHLTQQHEEAAAGPSSRHPHSHHSHHSHHSRHNSHRSSVNVRALDSDLEQADGFCSPHSVASTLWTPKVFEKLQRAACTRDEPLPTLEYQVNLDLEAFAGDSRGAAEQLWQLIGDASGGELSLDCSEDAQRVMAMVTLRKVDAAHSPMKEEFGLQVRDRYYEVIESTSTVPVESYRAIDLKKHRTGWHEQDCVGDGTIRGLSKTEQDVHVCDSKESRGVKIYDIPEGYVLREMGDLYNLFPALEQCASESIDASTRLRSSHRVEWTWSQYGWILPEGLPYKMETWLSFETLEQARAGVNATGGEWSIRLFADEDGNFPIRAHRMVNRVHSVVSTSALAEAEACEVPLWLIVWLGSVLLAVAGFILYCAVVFSRRLGRGLWEFQLSDDAVGDAEDPAEVEMLPMDTEAIKEGDLEETTDLEETIDLEEATDPTEVVTQPL